MNLTLNSTPMEQTFPGYLPLLLFFSSSNVGGFFHSCALLVVHSSVLIPLLPFPCFFSKCGHARNLSFSVECASNHSSFNMFWLSFCVFSHVGSSCLLLHSDVLWQQVILFHIGKTPCEHINLYIRFSRIMQRWRSDILKFFGIDFSLACVDLCWNCKWFFFLSWLILGLFRWWISNKEQYKAKWGWGVFGTERCENNQLYRWHKKMILCQLILVCDVTALHEQATFAVKHIFDIDFRGALSASFLPYWCHNIFLFTVDNF